MKALSLLLLLVGCSGIFPEEPKNDPNAPRPEQCAAYCEGLSTCDPSVGAPPCVDECRNIIADPEELRTSGFTRKGLDCVARAEGCEAIKACPL